MSQTTTIKVGESAKTITLPEGMALILTGSAGASGVAYLLDQALGGMNSQRSWTIGAGALNPIGPYEGTQKIHLTCAAGSIAARVLDAVLTIQAGGGATKPATPAAPVLTALASAISVAYTVPADGGSAILEAQFLDINGVTTALTGSPQTIAATAGTPITGTTRFRNAVGWSDWSPQSNQVTPTAPVRTLRVVTTQNRIAPSSATISGTARTRLAARIPYVIGSGDADGIDLSWSYFIGLNPDITTLSPMALSGVVMEANSVTPGKHLNVKGQSYPYTLQSGANKVQHDTLLPADLGMSVFTPGDKLWLKIYADFTPVSGAVTYPAQVDRIPVSDSANQLWSIFDPTLISASSIMTPGKPTATLVATGAATTFPVTSGGVIVPFALGTFVNERANRRPSYSCAGDSNSQGFKSTKVALHGKGEFQEFLVGDGSNSRLLAGINMGFTGATIAQQSHDKLIAWHQYADDIFDEVIANSFNNGATNYLAVQTDKQTLWTKLHAINPGARIYSTDVGPHTEGAWTMADQSDQTQTAGYGLGGPVNIFRAWQQAQVGLSTGIFKFIKLTPWREGLDEEKWTPGRTPDGTHGDEVCVTAKAVQLATEIPII